MCKKYGFSNTFMGELFRIGVLNEIVWLIRGYAFFLLLGDANVNLNELSKYEYSYSLPIINSYLFYKGN